MTDDALKRHVVTTTADTMQMRAPQWLYDLRIPVGAITLLAGREGIGKSTIDCSLASDITNGTMPGEYEGTPKDVGIVASEDAWEEVIVPRLTAVRADLSRVHRIDARTEEGKEDIISVPADLTSLAAVVAQHDIVLLLLDPLMSVIHGGIDTHKDRETRRALDPLARFANATGVAVLGNIHVNKSSGTDPLNSIMGSRAFTAAARSVLYCIVDPDAEHEDRFLMGHPKSNLGPKQPTLRYSLMSVKIELDDGTVIATSRVLWHGDDLRSIRDAMETPRIERPVGALAARIEQWVMEQGRAVSVDELAEQFPDIERATLNRNLARMVKRGTLTRPVYGHYTIRRSQ